MSKAHEILAQQASAAKIRAWATGNAVAYEVKTSGYETEFLYSDGSMIIYVAGIPTAYAQTNPRQPRLAHQ